MKNWLNLNMNTPWVKGFEGPNSNPVYKHCDNPDKWDVECNRLIMSSYGEGNAIDIRLMNTDSDLQHQLNITVEDGKLKAIVSEQTK